MDEVIVLWTANTERYCDVIEGVNDTAQNLKNAIAKGHPEVSPSTLFAYASIMQGVREFLKILSVLKLLITMLAKKLLKKYQQRLISLFVFPVFFFGGSILDRLKRRIYTKA